MKNKATAGDKYEMNYKNEATAGDSQTILHAGTRLPVGKNILGPITSMV